MTACPTCGAADPDECRIGFDVPGCDHPDALAELAELFTPDGLSRLIQTRRAPVEVSGG